MSDMGVYKCTSCKQRFMTQEALAGHIKTHQMDGENGLWKCDDCNQTYLTEQAFKSHVCAADSTNQRELECSNCGAMKRMRSTATRQKAQCYQCNEYTVFEVPE